MISIIICHKNEVFLKAIKENIHRTIGTPYELIIIDNRLNQHSIFSAYNEGVKKSKYNICCFSHEDVLFYTTNWGKNVIAHFQDKTAGMIGVAGGMVQPNVPSAWWYNYHYGQCAINLFEDQNSDIPKELITLPSTRHYHLNPFNDSTKTEVVILDGLWFCIRRSLFEKIRFDENTFSGFHFYDADISLQVRQHAKVFVVYDILLQHFSRGVIQKEYYEQLLCFTRKWLFKLPQYSTSISLGQARKTAWYSLRRFLLDTKAAGFSKKEIIEVQNEYLPLLQKKYFSFWHWMYFKLSGLFGYKLVNALFYRVEKLRNVPGRLKMKVLPVDVGVKKEAIKVSGLT